MRRQSHAAGMGAPLPCRTRRRLLPALVFGCAIGLPVVDVTYAQKPSGIAAGHEKSGAFNRALGVDCEYCHHAPGSSEAPKPQYLFAQRMSRMADGINGGILKSFGGVTCWTCHRGRTKPGRLPVEKWESVQAAHAAVFVGPREDYGVTMSVYAASLGVECSHCHEPGAWAKDVKPAKETTREMLKLFDEIPTYFEKERQPRLQCFMCHQGQTKPERAPN